MKETIDMCVKPEELSAHLEGDLEESRASEVEEHIKNCVRCFGVVRDFGEIKTDLKDLSAARPGLNLWRKIDDALDEDLERSPRRRNWMGWLLPIPVAAAAVLAILLMRPTDRQKDTEKDHAETRDIATAMETVERAEAAYLDAILSLEKVYKTEKSNFSPETLAVIEESLGDIDTAINRCRKAMILDPGGMDANRAMLAAYRQKMDFLFELVGPQVPTSRSVK